MTTTPDFRALCAELLDELQYQTSYETNAELQDRARTALATTPPKPPTEKDLREMFDENDWNYISPETFEDIARTVLQEWGNYPAIPDSSIHTPLPHR
jgi:hypothetical protein